MPPSSKVPIKFAFIPPSEVSIIYIQFKMLQLKPIPRPRHDARTRIRGDERPVRELRSSLPLLKLLQLQVNS